MASDQIIQKLGKIKAHQESAAAIGNEAEAEHFARMLNQLLMKHKLEMTDIEYEAEIKEEPVESTSVGKGIIYRDGKKYYKEYPDVEVRSKRQDWSEKLARIICSAHSCKMLVEHRSSRLYFVGRKTNTVIAEYMYITMYRTIERLSWKEYKTARNKTKWQQIKGLSKEEQKSVYVDYSELEGYRAGWVSGFIYRLQEMFREIEEVQAKDPSMCTALIRIDKDKAAIGQWMQDNTCKAGSLGGSNRGNSQGYSDGKVKANEVGLTARGMNRGTSAKQLK